MYTIYFTVYRDSNRLNYRIRLRTQIVEESFAIEFAESQTRRLDL